jgi:hypothetical protein
MDWTTTTAMRKVHGLCHGLLYASKLNKHAAQTERDRGKRKPRGRLSDLLLQRIFLEDRGALRSLFADHFQCMLEVQQPPKGRVKSEHGPKNRTIENFTNFGGVNGIS